MTMLGYCRPLSEAWSGALDRCCGSFPCLSDSGRRSSLGLKVALVMLHLIYVGVLFLVDGELLQKTTKEPWYTASYLILFVVTLVQYFFTSGSSPGYVLDAMGAVYMSDALIWKTSVVSKQPASSKKDSLVITVDRNQTSTNVSGANATSWMKMVLDMYPPGSSVRHWTCSYCNVVQPPRAKHCHDCDKCVLQFDHHCVWLGTCIGQGNHCRFWWYICEDTGLCLWTVFLYITYLNSNISRAWWTYAIMILLLITLSISLIFLLLLMLFHTYLVLTNQTTYELVRRRRIPYLREIPEKVYPFSKGICRNLYNFCCARGDLYRLEPLPSEQELEDKIRPYTCSDVLSCRCC